MKYRFPNLVESVALLYSLFQCKGLMLNWMNSPLDRYGWTAFLLWCVPVVLFWIRNGDKEASSKGTTQALIVAGLALSLLGTLSELNALKHIGLAAVIAGLLPFSPAMLPWLALSICWMSIFSWIAMRTIPSAIIPFRLGLSLLAAGIGILGLTRIHKEFAHEEE